MFFSADDPIGKWIGGSDVNNNDVNRWLDDTLVATGYTNWYPGGQWNPEPSNGNQNHMLIWLDDGTWGDWHGTLNLQYICQAGLI